MDAKERGQKISEIIENISNVRRQVEDRRNEVEYSISKVVELNDIIGSIGDVEGWNLEDLIRNIIATMLNNLGYQLLDDIENFKDELEEYMSWLSDSRREKLEEKYSELDTVHYMGSKDFESIDDVISMMNEAEELLKRMK